METHTTVDTHPIGNALVVFASVLISCCALYFGLFSCGGYVWHKELFRFVIPIIVISAILVPSNLLSSYKRKIAFLLILATGYVILEAAFATIYFQGGNWREYGHTFITAIEFGPC